MFDIWSLDREKIGYWSLSFNKVFHRKIEDEAKTQSESRAKGNPLRAVLICWRRLNTNAPKKKEGYNYISKRLLFFYFELKKVNKVMLTIHIARYSSQSISASFY